MKDSGTLIFVVSLVLLSMVAILADNQTERLQAKIVELQKQLTACGCVEKTQ